jgi:methylase of polypeptide subunit release factors
METFLQSLSNGAGPADGLVLRRPSARHHNEDLPELGTKRAVALAESLNEALRKLKFDELNEISRADYACSPFAATARLSFAKTIDDLEGTHLSKREADALRFFALGRPLSIEQLRHVLGKDCDGIIEVGISLGLFSISPSKMIALNELLLASRKCGETVIHFFADIPPHHNPLAGIQRVYAEIDSYFLNAKLQSLSGISGVVAEAGSGSGVQLITLLALNSEITEAIGIECDARARNVSKFNAAMNLMGDRFTIVQDESGLSAALAGRKLSFACSNPPFLACPAVVKVLGSDQQIQVKALFNRAGWGGDDGLEVTKYFLQILEPHMAQNSETVIYSQFGGDMLYPTTIQRLERECSDAKGAFEFFPREGSGAYTFHLRASDWAAVLSATLAQEHPDIPERTITDVDFGIMKSLREQGIEKLHSGIVTLTRGVSPVVHGDLAKQESALDLYCMNSGAGSLLSMRLKLFGKDELLSPPDVGGCSYEASRDGMVYVVKLDQVWLERELVSVDGRKTTLQVGSCDGESFYLIRQGDTVVEFAPVDFDAPYGSQSYHRAVQAIKILPPHEVLRNLRIGFGGVIKAEIINELYNSKHTRDFWLELMPALNKFRLSYKPYDESDPYSVRLGAMKFAASEQNTFRCASMFSTEFLRLCKRIGGVTSKATSWEKR